MDAEAFGLEEFETCLDDLRVHRTKKLGAALKKPLLLLLVHVAAL